MRPGRGNAVPAGQPVPPSKEDREDVCPVYLTILNPQSIALTIADATPPA